MSGASSSPTPSWSSAWTRTASWCWPTRSSPPIPAAFWNRDEYQVGTSPLSYDKQYLRDWLIENKLDGVTPAPQLPADVVAKTQEKYLECLERLVPQK